jgi:tetratricopeptide (TPR) repeat protein
MSSKHARKAANASLAPAVAPRQEVEKLIQKDRLKDAVKAAKLCFKEDSTPENHRLLERVYFLRARQLLQLGMADSATEVAEHLLEFGFTSDEWADDFVRLLINLGLSDQAFQIQSKSGHPELNDQLIGLAADQVITHPGRTQSTLPAIGHEANLIRESLEKITAGDFESGLSSLRDLPRSSLLSDWKLFARGLAAHYQGENEECRANWDRLDPLRKPYRIAGRLRQLSGAVDAFATDSQLAIVEKTVFGEPVLARIAELQALTADQNWPKATRLLASVRHSLRRIDRRLAQRLTRILMPSFVDAASKMDLDDGLQLLEDFTRVAEPIAIDPTWNRFWAIATDELDVESATPIKHWMRYAGELETIPAFTPAERPLVEAMTCNRVAVYHRDDAESLDSPESMMMLLRSMFGRNAEGGEAAARSKKLAVECLERSLHLAPNYLRTHQILIDLHKHWKNQAALESAARRLLEQFPHDHETLILLVDFYVKRERFDDAMSYVQRARALKPLDQSLREKESVIRIGLARHCALAGQWDEGREHFSAAEVLSPDLRHQFTYLARKSLFEAKASKRDASDQFLKEAQAALDEPTPLWMVLAIESIRYGMSAATTRAYAELWAADLKKKCQSKTAGEMASTLLAYLQAGVEYPGRANHVGQLTAYLKRTTRLKYQQADIESVCAFLHDVPDQERLLDKLLKTGLKRYPDSAVLNFEAGMLAITRSSPPFINPAAKIHLEKALTLVEASTLPTMTALLPSIKAALTMINELSFGPRRLPFGDGPFGFPMDDFDPFDFFDDDDFTDDGDDDDFEVSPRRVPRPKSKKHKKQKKK